MARPDRSEVQRGWWAILDRLDADLAAMTDGRAEAIKAREKLGGLWITTPAFGYDPELAFRVEARCRQAEAEAEWTDDSTGRPGLLCTTPTTKVLWPIDPVADPDVEPAPPDWDGIDDRPIEQLLWAMVSAVQVARREELMALRVFPGIVTEALDGNADPVGALRRIEALLPGPARQQPV